MKKYEIKELYTDNYLLEIEGEEPIKIKKDLGLLMKMQKTKTKAKLKMIADLKAQNLTKEDLCIKTVVDGKLQEDWSEYEALVKEYQDESQQEAGIQLFTDLLGMDILTLLTKLESKSDAEAQKFTADFMSVIFGVETNTPSEEK